MARLVVVPNQRFGMQAKDMGLIADDERWLTRDQLDRTRGMKFDSWRYLDTLDQPPPIGASQDVIEAWLARPDESPFPPLDTATRVQLDAMVMFSAP